MGSGIFFPICALPFSILILFLFLKKEHINSIETRIYKILIITNFIGLLLELLCSYASYIYDTNKLLSNLIYKSYLVYLLNWTAIFTYYVYRVSVSKNLNFNKLKKIILALICILINLVVYLLPIELVTKNNKQIRYTAGESVIFAYIISGVLVMFMLYILYKNRINIKRKKYIPVFVFFVVGTSAIITQMLVPELLLITYVETCICVIMYFTIENPDLKMLNEFIVNRKLTENSIQEKSNLLFQVSQNVKNPLIEITNFSNDILKTDDISSAHEYASKIDNISRNVTRIINNVLDISQMEKQNIKIVDTKYNVFKLVKEIIYLTKNKYRDSNNDIEFKYNISNSIPEFLYGDSLKIKQVICSILFNAFQNTQRGFVDFDVSHIVKYDICRLIISISDTGVGMNLEKINSILENEEEIDEKELKKIENLDVNLNISKKIIDMLGGALIIKSEINKGTTFTIVLNQKIGISSDNSKLNLLINSLSNKKKLLLIDDDYLELQKYALEFKKSSFNVSSTMFGYDCIEKLKNNENFDLIFVDDNLEDFNAIDILKEVKKLKIKNLKIIIMLEKEKEFMKDKFLRDYSFTDYFLKDNFETEISRIIKKYVD